MDQIGKYEVQKKVRQSSSSDLYLCFDPDLKMQVAVKLFLYDDGEEVRMTSQDRAFWENRFVSEARLMARLDHPNIVPVRELGYMDLEGQPTPFIVMPFVEANLRFEIGHDINKPLADYTGNPKDPLFPKIPSLRRSLDLLLGVADALSYLHQNGVVHRDIKTSNILLTRRKGGWPKICDFGFAFRTGSGNPQSQFWLGTEHFIAPEQRKNADRATPASDVFSLGVLAYRLLCGALPVGAYPAISEVRSDVPDDLTDLVGAMIAEDPDQRPAQAKQVLTRLQKIDPSIARHVIRLKETQKTTLRLR